MIAMILSVWPIRDYVAGATSFAARPDLVGDTNLRLEFAEGTWKSDLLT
jgi:hypothetical protein